MVPELPMTLDRRASRPLARQVADHLREAAAQGLLRIGDRLPSTRALAASLGVSRTVTAAAYEQLVAEGWIEAKHGSGSFLAAEPPVPGGLRRTTRSVRTDPRRGSSAPPDAQVDLRPGSPWAAGLVESTWRRAWRRAGDAAPDPRPVRAGLPAYRAAVAEHLLRHRGLGVSGGAVLATGGTSAALTELALAWLEPGDAVAVEEPGYPRAVGALRAAGLRVLPVRVDGGGLVVDDLPENARAVYCTPAHQFPLGARLSASRRMALVQWARDTGATIIEDDYDGELRYDVAPLPMLAAVGPDVVVHLGTSSKIMTPTLGVGWMVAPRSIIAAVLAYRNSAGIGPSLAGQRVVTAMAESGDLSRHLRRVRRELAVRRDIVASKLATAGRVVVGDRAGAHLVTLVDGPDDERWAIAAAAASGVALDGVGRCFAGVPDMAGITLGYAAPARRDDLERGLEVFLNLARG
ncbi:PLP-dependent aminotransferase family protein [Phytoactinopolyspora alkaliphila]|uniref:PLP-dependent aminotransferase family protein n=1 Tax=Phytoactinopolyspora alkaliphila TaxID=1783498 RepID=A0A6N9YG50_9ACTN|nr:PLP-dependent aminotransferase family protein [Phytoactinopolyspora alkaliphila]NED93888.1 PLP-dependent aminotransferase family protein [Phytoactinopolyspora alkaliphila]